MPCGAIASYPEQCYVRSKALHCITAERNESAGQRGTVLVLQRNKYLGIKEALQILRFSEFLKSLEIDLAVTRLGIA